MLVPCLIGRLARGEHNAGDGARRFMHEMWRGEFDDPPDAAGAEVIVNDDELHDAKQCGQRHTMVNRLRWERGTFFRPCLLMDQLTGIL